MEQSNIKHHQNEMHGKFYMGDDEHNSAELTYSKAGNDKLIIDHTWVDPKMRKKGIGERLVKTAVDYAREANLKIIPLCTFAQNIFAQRTEMHDVLMEKA